MEFHDYVRSLGLDPLALSPEASDALESAWRANQAGNKKTGEPAPAASVNANGKADPLGELTSKAEAENARRDGIVALIGTYLQKNPDRVQEYRAVGQVALDGGWSVKDTEFHLLKASYANGPVAFAPSRPQIIQAVVEASVCRAAGLDRETVERSYGDQVLTAADRHFKGGCSLQRLLSVAAAAHGHKDAHISNPRHLLRAAFGGHDGLASGGYGPSTYDVGGILSNVANKFIVSAFNAVEMAWKQITATRPVSDFKQITSYALTGDLSYKKIGPGGEVKHGTLGETEYTNKAEMYGLMLGIDYQHLRNDDLGAFAQLARRLGRGGALTINDVFWAAFLAGQGTFWVAANDNYYAHADYAFTLEKLANAHVAWTLREDPDGKPMGDEARFLLVPPALEIPARQYMSSLRLSEDGGEGEANVLAGKWTVVSSRYLANTSITGSSTTNYFLVADPAETPVIETVFLDGQEMPTVETAEPDLSRMGIMIRGTHAFGVTKQEPRGAIKFKQTAD